MSSSPDGPLTLATVAAHLGISRSTVSNAYNHPDQLSPALRERILTVAEELGYTGPNPVARRLRKGRAGAIGVLFSDPLHYAFADVASQLFLEGVARAGEETDSAMLLIPARPSKESAAIVTNSMVDGFLLYSIPPGHPFVDAALRRKLPVVCVDQVKIGGVSWVGIDDQNAARDAATHLLSLGHRKIAIVVFGLGPDEQVHNHQTASGDSTSTATSVSWLRIEGYGAAFSAAGLTWKDVEIYECDRNTEQAGEEAAASLLRAQNPPTAVLCTSDVLALGFMRAAKDLGANVPNDVSVVGFNDLPQAAEAGLTTVRQPLHEKGRQAAQLLLDPTSFRHTTIKLEADLVIRKTTCEPR